MAHFLFIDESGFDSGPSPYGVLGGVAIEDRDIWNVITAMQEAELRHFGTRYSPGRAELKAKKLISAQVFRQAAMAPKIPQAERAELAKRCLEQGQGAPLRAIAALAQAKLEDLGPSAFGVAVFDELEKIQSHLLVGQMDSYFKQTSTGRQRAGRILPEPLFVHSDLTTGVQIADLVAYILSWGWRLNWMTKPARRELAGYVAQVCQLRHRAVREVAGNPQFVIWSFAFITDLRSHTERLIEDLSGLPGGERQ